MCPPGLVYLHVSRLSDFLTGHCPCQVVGVVGNGDSTDGMDVLGVLV